MKSVDVGRQRALITGGSSGIGLAIGKELARRGYDLLLVSNQEARLAEVKLQIENEYGVDCSTIYIDLVDSLSAEKLFEYCASNKLKVDILVNNAGMLIFSEMISVGSERINAILGLHIHTPTMLCRLFGDKMKMRRDGHILNISSISSVMPYPGISLYGPSKTYMRYFSRAFRGEMKLYDVKVTCLLPGATETGLYDPRRVNLKLAKRLGIMQSPEFVARKAVNALFKNKQECIPGLINKLAVFFLPLIPSGIIYWIHRNTDLVKKGNEALEG
ncbi:MAG TPA: SDR family NAD(P)-dependent oxidoreductase [Saprospiraceae bacterium]|nr:SDR family NAD(P)-dependent oxidoreductase [Saprospiraceae bacterium]